MADAPIVPPPEPVSTEAQASTPPPAPNAGEAAVGTSPQGDAQPSAHADSADKAPVPDPAVAREAFFAKWKQEDPKTETPEAKTPDEEKEPEETAPTAADPDDNAETAAEEMATKSPAEVRKRHKKLADQRNEARAKLAEAEPLAQLGTDIITTASQAGWTPQQYVQVMQTVVAAQRGDPAAIARLQGLVKIPAPQTTWTSEDEAVLTDLVATGDITGEAAKAIRVRVLKGQSAVQPPAPQAPPVAPPVQQRQQAPPVDVTPKIADALDRATKGVSEADLPKIDAEIKKELGVYRQRHPELARESYPAVIEAIASGIVQRHKAAARQVPAIRPSLRPGSTPTPPTTGQTSTKESFFSKW